jgi:hypothetical protein
MGSLWGDLSNLKRVRTPKTILVEQANILNSATNGVIRADVSSENLGSGSLSHELSLVAPALDNYRYGVCMVIHDIEIYPCKLFNFALRESTECANEDELKEELSQILGDGKTKKILEALLSQSQE